jgi:glycosyltransferase involved in cell wall biosynthesis
MADFPTVTLLITHYNRSKSLERLLSAFKMLDVVFGDIIVSDDSSKGIHIDAIKYLQTQYDFKLITTPVNRGLGNNLNKGQDAVTTPYTLYVQEDFVPTHKFLPSLGDAYKLMQESNEIDIARFYAYYSYPYLKPYAKGFAKMLYRLWAADTSKIYVYTDHPHLRRSSFLEKFGRYKEGIKSDRTEYLMCISFIQNKGVGLFYNDFNDLFVQENTSDEPSTVIRADWRKSNNLLVGVLRNVFRQIKYNFDIHLGKSIKSTR